MGLNFIGRRAAVPCDHRRPRCRQRDGEPADRRDRADVRRLDGSRGADRSTVRMAARNLLRWPGDVLGGARAVRRDLHDAALAAGAFAAGAATVMGGLPPAVMSWFPTRELPLINGTNIVGQSTGVTVSVFSVAAIAGIVGWRESLMLFGLIALAGVGVFALLAREPERPVGAAPPNPGLSMGLLVTIFRDRRTLLLSFGVAGGFGAFLGLSSWLPTYYQQSGAGRWSAPDRCRDPLVLRHRRLAHRVCAVDASGSSQAVHHRCRVAHADRGLRQLRLGVAADAVPQPRAARVGSWLHLPSVLTMPMEFRGVTLERATLSVAMLLTLGNITGFLSPLMIGYLRDQTGSFELGPHDLRRAPPHPDHRRPAVAGDRAARAGAGGRRRPRLVATSG